MFKVNGFKLVGSAVETLASGLIAEVMNSLISTDITKFTY
jgi:hypothetical protein